MSAHDPNPPPNTQGEAEGCGGWLTVPMDDPVREFANSILPLDMIEAGEMVIDMASQDLANYCPGQTIDWDGGMIAVAVYRAMLNAAPAPPSERSRTPQVEGDISRDEQISRLIAQQRVLVEALTKVTPLLETLASFPLPEDGASPQTVLERGSLAGKPPYRWAVGDEFLRDARKALSALSAPLSLQSAIPAGRV